MAPVGDDFEIQAVHASRLLPTSAWIQLPSVSPPVVHAVPRSPSIAAAARAAGVPDSRLDDVAVTPPSAAARAPTNVSITASDASVERRAEPDTANDRAVGTSMIRARAISSSAHADWVSAVRPIGVSGSGHTDSAGFAAQTGEHEAERVVGGVRSDIVEQGGGQADELVDAHARDRRPRRS